MRFKQWFETMTSTASVATFARPVVGMTTRTFPDSFTGQIKKKKKKKKKKD